MIAYGQLLEECDKSKAKDLSIIVKIALSTGARWSEAEGLTSSQVTPYKITFTKTKGKAISDSSVRNERTFFNGLSSFHSPNRCNSLNIARK